MKAPSTTWPQLADRVLALLCLLQALVAVPGFTWLNVRASKGPASYDPDDVYLDLLSSVALLLLLSYGLWTHRAWAYFGLGLGSAALIAATIAVPAHPVWSWPVAGVFAALVAFSVWRFRLTPKPV